MGDTVIIKGKSVATAGTDHAALSKVDMIKPNGKPPAKKYVNVARSKNVGSKATHTFIAGAAIWTEPSKIPESEAAPKTPGPGDPSGTWCKEATAKSTVDNVFVEGQRVIRLGDPTVQNHENCKGKVVTGAEADAALAAANAGGDGLGDTDAAGAGDKGGDKGGKDDKKKKDDGGGGKDKKKTWIEIQLVCQCKGAETPVPGKKLTLTMGGVSKDATTDGAGKARVEGIDPGSWTVKFPDLHESESDKTWEWGPLGGGKG